VNTGTNPWGFFYQENLPSTTVSTKLGGISTAGGGNVTINTGGDVTSYNPVGPSLARRLLSRPDFLPHPFAMTVPGSALT